MEQAAVARFFSAPTYAVVGASADPSKWGHKVLVWYLAHSLPITPIHPTLASIPTPSFSSSPSQSTLSSLSLLPSPHTTSLSLITRPAVTLQLLREAQEAGIHSVWLQPGTYDDKVMALLKGDEWWNDRWVGEGDEGVLGKGRGWCVLEDGDNGIRWAKEGEAKGKL